MRATLERLLEGHDLSRDEAESLLEALAAPGATEAAVAGVLTALRCKGETPDEVAGFAGAMRRLAAAPVLERDRPVLDIVGTGGDRSESFNLSTGAALVAAAAGGDRLLVAKHGNRAVSGRCGSADVLETLGVPIDLPPERLAEAARGAPFVFLFAPHYHVATRSIAGVRRSLGVRTVFNLLGPLTNPARPDFAVIGACTPQAARLLADALARLGVRRAFVVHGAEGWDEPTPVGPFTVFEVTPGTVREGRRDPLDAGLPRCGPDDLRGGDAPTNAAALRRVLHGERGAHRDAVVLGAALGLEVAGLAPNTRAAVDLARAAIDDGRAAGLLDRLTAPRPLPEVSRA